MGTKKKKNYLTRTPSISVSGQLFRGQKAAMPLKIVNGKSKMHISILSQEHREFQPQNSE